MSPDSATAACEANGDVPASSGEAPAQFSRSALFSGNADSSAILSTCGTYRYVLQRRFGAYAPRGRVLFVMLNPSTADHAVDDPTIRRCIGFAKWWRHQELAVVNLFALRATNPKELKAHPDPFGPLNTHYLEDQAAAADVIIAAWGSNEFAQTKAHDVTRLLTKYKDVQCLGYTRDGHPRHPLYMKNGATPMLFSSKWEGLE